MSSETNFPPMHYADWLQRYAMTRPKMPAVVAPRLRLNFAQLYGALHLVAHRLEEAGVRKGETIAMCFGSQALYLVFAFALNRMGCVPLDVMRREQAGTEIDLPSGIAIDRVLLEQPFAGIAPAGALNVDHDWVKPSGERKAEWSGPGFTDSDAIAHIFTTSGTTGLPKLIPQSSRQLEMRLHRRQIGILGVGHGDPGICMFSARAMAGFNSTVANMWSGAPTFLGWPEEAIPGIIARERIGRMSGSPMQYRRIVQSIGLTSPDLSSLKAAICAGSTLPEQLVRGLRSKLCRLVINAYGSTEVGTVAFGLPSGSAQVGYMVPWVHGQTVDENDKPLPVGVEGILRFRAEFMATGYANDPIATAQFFKDGWFYPGDVGTISEQRALTVSGRSTERINAGGLKLAPETVESAILDFAGILDCAAFGVPDNLGVDHVWAAFVSEGDIDVAALNAHCLTKLGPRAPRRFVRLEKVPRNQNGKVLRGELKKLAAGR